MNMDELATYISDTRNKTIPEVEKELRQLSKKKLPLGYIEDEDKSVKWNREYVEKFNDDLNKQEVELRDKVDILKTSMYDALRKYIVEYGEGIITYNDANRIINHLDDDEYYFNDGVYNTISSCEDIVDLFIAHYKEIEDGKKL